MNKRYTEIEILGVGRYLLTNIDLEDKEIEIETLEGTQYDFINKKDKKFYLSFEGMKNDELNVNNINVVIPGFNINEFNEFLKL